MKKRGFCLLLLFLISTLTTAEEFGESEESFSLSPAQSESLRSIELGQQGSVQVVSANINTFDGVEGEVAGSVSRTGEGLRVERASRLSTHTKTVTGASEVFVNNDRVAFSSANQFSSERVSGAGLVDAGEDAEGFFASGARQLSTKVPYSLSLNNIRDVGFSFSGNQLVKARFSFTGTVQLTHPFSLNDVFIDTDNDGLSDIFEINNKLNPGVLDTDSDGLSDADEVLRIPTDPLLVDTYVNDSLTDDYAFSFLLVHDSGIFDVVNPLNDSDGDSISNVNEYKYGFDPLNHDSDGDSFPDGFELVRGLNPVVPDVSCPDCGVILTGEQADVILDLTQYVGNVDGSRITYELSKANLVLGRLNLTINDSTKPARITFEKTLNGLHIIAENEIGQMRTFDFAEFLLGSPLDFFMTQQDGVLRAVLPSPGTYRYVVEPKDVDYYGFLVNQHRSFAQSYELYRPTGLEPYTLFFDKKGQRYVFDQYKEQALPTSAYVSFIDHVVQLRGMVTYARLGFERGLNTWKTRTTTYVEHTATSNQYLPLIESQHSLNRFTLQLDPTNTYITVNANLPQPLEQTSLYRAYFDDFLIRETAQGGKTTMYRRWQTGTPPILKEFSSNTHDYLFAIHEGIVQLSRNGHVFQTFTSLKDGQRGFEKHLAKPEECL